MHLMLGASLNYKQITLSLFLVQQQQKLSRKNFPSLRTVEPGCAWEDCGEMTAPLCGVGSASAEVNTNYVSLNHSGNAEQLSVCQYLKSYLNIVIASSFKGPVNMYRSLFQTKVLSSLHMHLCIKFFSKRDLEAGKHVPIQLMSVPQLHTIWHLG